MARCPFAQWDEISGDVGAYSGGPFKIVHHTTEGTSYEGARSAYAAKKVDPHFTVAGNRIYQHVDTNRAARALKNLAGGVETNRDSAVQIEVVGFAGRAKDITTLKKVADLCRWIESEHGVPQDWPNGRPRASANGQDPGGHNRDPSNWDSNSGHYGHSQVPENIHWDPGYTESEVALVTPDAIFDPHQELAAARVEVIHELTPGAIRDAEQIARRLLADALGQLSHSSADQGAHVRVRVVTGTDEIEIDVDLVPPRTAASRKSKRKVTRKKR